MMIATVNSSTLLPAALVVVVVIVVGLRRMDVERLLPRAGLLYARLRRRPHPLHLLFGSDEGTGEEEGTQGGSENSF